VVISSSRSSVSRRENSRPLLDAMFIVKYVTYLWRVLMPAGSR
jgi:hypothetical protein